MIFNQTNKNAGDVVNQVSRQHCWHFTGICLLSVPPQYEQVCCLCGKKRHEISGHEDKPDGHGPFYPKQTFTVKRTWWIPEDVGPCERDV